jgi:lactoylglutathione lyase
MSASRQLFRQQSRDGRHPKSPVGCRDGSFGCARVIFSIPKKFSYNGVIVAEQSFVTSDVHNSNGGSLHGTAFAAALTCNDLQKSLAWYESVLGFAVDRKHEREGKLQAVSLVAGDVRLLIGQDDGKKGWDRVKGQAVSLQITTDQNVDEIANRIKAAGGVLETEPTDLPWGPRAFRVKDPDGFLIVITT